MKQPLFHAWAPDTLQDLQKPESEARRGTQMPDTITKAESKLYIDGKPVTRVGRFRHGSRERGSAQGITQFKDDIDSSQDLIQGDNVKPTADRSNLRGRPTDTYTLPRTSPIQPGQPITIRAELCPSMKHSGSLRETWKDRGKHPDPEQPLGLHLRADPRLRELFGRMHSDF